MLDWKESSRPLRHRRPAETADSTDCHTLVQNLFLTEHYEINHHAALVDKKLLSFSNKFVTIQHPRMDWMNRARKALNQSIRNWNNHRHPAFYLFNEEEILPAARNYFETLEKTATEQLPLTRELSENQAMVSAWIKSYQNYQRDVDQLLDERISLQYNLSLIKKLKLKKDETRDIKLVLKRGGKMVEEIITLRKEDQNLGHLIKRFQTEIQELDGTLLKNGKIKDRIIRQAMLNDILIIVHRELEHAIKNASSSHEAVARELTNLEQLIKAEELRPTTYGVYRITNKTFTREALALSKLDVAYNKIKDPMVAIKEVFVDFLKNRSTREVVDEKEKIGMFKRIYNKIASITPRQAAYGTGTTAVLAYGYHQYFWIHKKEGNEVERMGQEELEPAHQEQLERTKEEATQKSEGHSEVIELSIDELTK